jgi:hypothetical protein
MVEFPIRKLSANVSSQRLHDSGRSRVIQRLSALDYPRSILRRPISSYLQPSFPIVSTDTAVETLFSLQVRPRNPRCSRGKVEGLSTKIDMLTAEV